MVTRFYVPQFITIEDKLLGLITFRQLFALLGAFLLTFFLFKLNQLIGFLLGLPLFGIAFLFTFVKVNGKPFMYVFPYFVDFLIRSRKYTWQKIEKFIYKEIEIPDVEELPIKFPEIKTRKIKEIPEREETPSIYSNHIAVELTYPEAEVAYKEKLTISLEEPIADQIKDLNKIIHRHMVNPQNPYRLFPYVKFYKALR